MTKYGKLHRSHWFSANRMTFRARAVHQMVGDAVCSVK
jgi:hypothetical protein